MNEIIKVNHVTMKFNLMEEKVDTLKEYVVRLLKRQLLYNEFISLDDISFSIEKGDVIGIVGLNGAGKSTLLKILAGVLQPTNGSVSIQGTIAPLIEVGAGFDPELTARENVYLNGAILGHSREFLDEKFQEIIEFAELERFVNVPVKNFSSGMYARLGFSIATLVNPDILIVDEVLSVGDYKFQEKCKKRIQNLMAGGTTVIIVSHDHEIIENMCNKVLWLESGKIKMYGDTISVNECYMHQDDIIS